MRLLKLRIEDTDKRVGREKTWDLDKILALPDVSGAFKTELDKLVLEVGSAPAAPEEPAPTPPAKPSPQPKAK